jgi:hypothetical protein
VALTYQILAKCPKTGQEVFTGATHDKPAFAPDEKPMGVYNCTACRESHVWTADEARVVMGAA